MDMRILTLLLIVITNSADAASCARCAASNKLRDFYAALNIESDNDRKAGHRSTAEVVKMLESFEKSHGASGRTSEFQALVNLASQALPYDPERSLSFRLKTIADSHPALKPILTKSVARISSQCHKTLFVARIEAYDCAQKSRGGIAVDKKGKPMTCGGSFDFEKCLKKSKK